MLLQIFENLLVALIRLKIRWELLRKLDNAIYDPRSEEEGPTAITHVPPVFGKGCQVTTPDAPATKTWIIHSGLMEYPDWKTSCWNFGDFR
jgi:hypothetical protein